MQIRNESKAAQTMDPSLYASSMFVIERHSGPMWRSVNRGAEKPRPVPIRQTRVSDKSMYLLRL